MVVCDMWDRHWSLGATRRVGQMVPGLNEFLRALRDHGALIVFAPAGTMAYYDARPEFAHARSRASAFGNVAARSVIDLPRPPLPFEISHGGSDTCCADDPPHTRTWTRQHPGLEIDLERDALTDRGEEVYALLSGENRRQVLFAGVHANLCVLDRPFGIRALLSWGFKVTLIRDFTDAMYDPAQPPYVDHGAGTELIIGYIENFLCPTTTSAELLSGLAGEQISTQHQPHKGKEMAYE